MNITLDVYNSHDGDGWVEILHAKSRKELARQVKSRNMYTPTGCGRDCTGMIFATTSTLLRAVRDGSEWVGIVYTQNSRDV